MDDRTGALDYRDSMPIDGFALPPGTSAADRVMGRLMAATGADQRVDLDVVDVVALVGAGTIAVVAMVGLLCATLGIHHLANVVVGSLVVVVVAGVIVRWRPVGVRATTWTTLALAVPALVAVVWLSFPGFHYATGDKDPGVYVMHALSIARHGSLTIPKTVLQRSGVLSVNDISATQWRGIVLRSQGGSITPSFFHLWPSLLATGFEAVGFRFLSVAVPLVALVSTLVLFALGRRVLNTPLAALAALALATNMMQVWQSRYPTSEMLAQLLFLGALCALVVAVQTDWAPAGALAGMLTTAGFLDRGEGLLLVLLFGAALAVAVALAYRVSLCCWCAVGLVVPLPLALWQAYHTARLYAAANSVPGAAKVAAVIAAEVVVAVVGYATSWGRRLGKALGSLTVRDGQLRRGLRWTALAALGLLGTLGVIRPLFGHTTSNYNGTIIRTYDEWSLYRLGLFMTPVGMLAAAVGLAWIIWTRWELARTLVAGVVGAFSVLFLYHARNSPQMMWWNRRFVPVVVPGLVLLAAGAVAAAMWSPRWRSAVVGTTVVALLGVCAYQAHQSAALRSLDERAGSYSVARDVAATVGGAHGVVLWQQEPCCGSPGLLFGSPTWIIGGADSALLPDEASAYAAYLHSIMAAVPDQSVFVALDSTVTPPAGTSVTYHRVKRFTGVLPAWVETLSRVPDHQAPLPFDFVIYRVQPAT